jgi:hypothetical protein
MACLIRRNRDVLLADLAGFKLVPEERARGAMSRTVVCR